MYLIGLRGIHPGPPLAHLHIKHKAVEVVALGRAIVAMSVRQKLRACAQGQGTGGSEDIGREGGEGERG